jgi:hypothetical protein
MANVKDRLTHVERGVNGNASRKTTKRWRIAPPRDRVA